jgi:hypothetical protein
MASHLIQEKTKNFYLRREGNQNGTIFKRGGRFQEQDLPPKYGGINKMAGKSIRWHHILKRRPVCQEKTKNPVSQE